MKRIRPILLSIAAVLGILGGTVVVFCISRGPWGAIAFAAVGAVLIVRRHPVLAMVLAAIPAFGSMLPAVKPPVTSEGLVARLWIENLSSLGGAYSVIWAPGQDTVVTTHAHTNALSGATVYTPLAPAFAPMATDGALWGSSFPGAVVVHEMPDGTRVRPGGPFGTSVSHFYDLVSGTWSSRTEKAKYRWSTWVAATRTLVVIEQTSPAPTIHGFDPDAFTAGGAPRWSYRVPIFSLEEARPDPDDPAVLYCRGDAGLGKVARLDTRTGEITWGHTHIPWVWSIEPDRRRPVLYLSHPFAGQTDVVDRRTMQVVDTFETGGMPRSIAHLSDLDLLAVGQYMGHQVAIFAPDGGWHQIASIPACQRVRAVSYDAQDRLLYYADSCGAHRAHIPFGWDPRVADGGLELALNHPQHG